MNSVEMILLIFSVSIFIAYATLILSFTLGWTKLPEVKLRERPETLISVIIPVRNEDKNVEDLLLALKEIDYPVHLREFIFIDDHSHDNTIELLKEHSDIPGLNILELPEERKGKKAAIAYGIDNASGSLITTLDADCLPGRNWLRTISSAYETYGYKMIAGPVAIARPEGWLASFQALELLSLIVSAGGAIGAGRPIMCNGANLAYEKDAFVEVRGFEGNEHIPGGDDIFLMEKFKRQYSRSDIGFNTHPESIVLTPAAGNLKEFINQRLRWVSKSPAYSDTFLILSSVIVLLLNLTLLIALVSAFISLPGLLIFLCLFLLKCIIDFPILWKATAFSGQTRLIGNLISFQLVYFIFVSLSGIPGLLIPFRWKERSGPHRSMDL